MLQQNPGEAEHPCLRLKHRKITKGNYSFLSLLDCVHAILSILLLNSHWKFFKAAAFVLLVKNLVWCSCQKDFLVNTHTMKPGKVATSFQATPTMQLSNRSGPRDIPLRQKKNYDVLNLSLIGFKVPMFQQFYYSYFSLWAPAGQPHNNNSKKKWYWLLS